LCLAQPVASHDKTYAVEDIRWNADGSTLVGVVGSHLPKLISEVEALLTDEDDAV
jgi:hypothetical protein